MIRRCLYSLHMTLAVQQKTPSVILSCGPINRLNSPRSTEMKMGCTIGPYSLSGGGRACGYESLGEDREEGEGTGAAYRGC